jgi:hypothetical protein
MYDESPKFSGRIYTVLTISRLRSITINAASENQANRYMSQEKPFGFAQGKKFGSWEPGLLPLEGMLDQKNYGVIDGYSR